MNDIICVECNYSMTYKGIKTTKSDLAIYQCGNCNKKIMIDLGKF